MRHEVRVAWLTALLAACSSSSSGSGEGGAGGAGGGTAPSTTSTSAGSGGAGGVGGAEWDPYGGPLLAWTRLQGAFDSIGQEPHVEGGYVPPTARRLVGCAVDAPDLGPYVVYLERAGTLEGAPPDRQFLVVFDEPGQSGPGGHFADAFIARLVAPEDWAGQCVVGTTLPLLGEVTRDVACELRLTRDESGTVSVSGPVMPAECVAASLDATTVAPSLRIRLDVIAWQDELDGGAEGRRFDPPGSLYNMVGSYELVRRSP